MGNSVVARNNAVDSQGVNASPAANWVSLHTADPLTSGTGELTPVSGPTGYARVLTSFPSAANGSVTSGTVTVNVPAGATIGWWGRWSAQTGGTYYQGGPLPASETYNSPGTYTIAINLQQSA